MRKKIRKLNTREFPLALCQIWGGCYKYFLNRKTKSFPRFIFKIKNGIVEAFRNEDMCDELCDLFYRRYERDRGYIARFNREYLKKFYELQRIWNRKYLGKKDIIRFAAKMKDFWPAIFASMYIPLSRNDFQKKDKELMINLRKRIDIAADEATHIILRSLEKMNPELGDLNFYIILEDLKEKIIDVKKIKRRSKKTIYIIDDEIANENKFKRLENKFNFKLEEINIPKVAKFSGSIAYPGIAKGKTKVVFKRKDVANVKKGEILVSAMTVPDFLPAMQKAAAFVTDEGGITCHAAIIAREMKKPCVIGTKIATKVLKDGDLVEVDATKGIVKIIKRK